MQYADGGKYVTLGQLKRLLNDGDLVDTDEIWCSTTGNLGITRQNECIGIIDFNNFGQLKVYNDDNNE